MQLQDKVENLILWFGYFLAGAVFLLGVMFLVKGLMWSFTQLFLT